MLERIGKDHRAFLTGEINHFVDNFELKRNESEVHALFKVTEIVGELKYEQCQRCATLAAANLNNLASAVNTLSAGVDEFLAKAKANTEKPPSESLLLARQNREERRAAFDRDFDHQYERIASSFEQKEEEIVELYADLELKLNIPR